MLRPNICAYNDFKEYKFFLKIIDIMKLMNKLIKVLCVVILIACKIKQQPDNDSNNINQKKLKHIKNIDAFVKEIKDEKHPIKLSLVAYCLPDNKCNPCKDTKNNILPEFVKDFSKYFRTFYVNIYELKLDSLHEKNMGPLKYLSFVPRFYFYYQGQYLAGLQDRRTFKKFVQLIKSYEEKGSINEILEKTIDSKGY